METPLPGADVAGWRQRARQFAEEEVLPSASRLAAERRIPPELVRSLGDRGLLALTIPSEWGGSAASAESVVAVLEEIARADAAVATLVSVHLSVAAAPIVEWGTPEQHARYLPRMARGEWLGAFGLTEPGVGSDTAHLSTRYAAVDGGYQLDGAKMFITNGGLADVIVTFATRDAASGSHGVTAFLLDRGRPGFTVAQRLEKLGLHASETTELVFDHVRLTKESRLGEEGKGLRVALKALTDGRVGIAACALGVAQAALEELRRLGQNAPSDALRIATARAYTEVAAARALIGEAARAKDRGQPFVELASAAKLLASQVAVRTAHAAFDAAGWRGAEAGGRTARLLEDARVFPIVEGTTEIQELILGRSLLGR